MRRSSLKCVPTRPSATRLLAWLCTAWASMSRRRTRTAAHLGSSHLHLILPLRAMMLRASSVNRCAMPRSQAMRSCCDVTRVTGSQMWTAHATLTDSRRLRSPWLAGTSRRCACYLTQASLSTRATTLARHRCTGRPRARSSRWDARCSMRVLTLTHVTRAAGTLSALRHTRGAMRSCESCSTVASLSMRPLPARCPTLARTMQPWRSRQNSRRCHLAATCRRRSCVPRRTGTRTCASCSLSGKPTHLRVYSRATCARWTTPRRATTAASHSCWLQ
mmetsp:Transcript_16420/g.42532  ORF Transcript_16420/g.42532 Transcript_16420/m.42532 type:complete len:276 (+) Transcript_16420:148-975(+)